MTGSSRSPRRSNNPIGTSPRLYRLECRVERLAARAMSLAVQWTASNTSRQLIREWPLKDLFMCLVPVTVFVPLQEARTFAGRRRREPARVPLDPAPARPAACPWSPWPRRRKSMNEKPARRWLTAPAVSTRPSATGARRRGYAIEGSISGRRRAACRWTRPHRSENNPAIAAIRPKAFEDDRSSQGEPADRRRRSRPHHRC